MKTTHFANLSRGILCAPENSNFCRIQSTSLEQKNMEQVIFGAGPDLLWRACSGEQCIIHDYSEKKRISRSQWQGIPFLVYCLNRAASKNVKGMIQRKERSLDVTLFFEDSWRSFSKSTQKYVKYFAKNIENKEIKIEMCTCRLDGK